MNNDTSIEDHPSIERINVATLRNVFFHSSTVSTDREKRLSVIEEPIPVVLQNSGSSHAFAPCDEERIRNESSQS